MKRSALKRTQPRRCWDAAREKVDGEGMCRLAGRHGQCAGRLEAAHIIGRERDYWLPLSAYEDAGLRIVAAADIPVAPVRVVPMCTRHHRLYDAHELDLLGHLTAEEEAQAVLDADGLELARRRLCPSAYKETVAA